jgi:SagB-type dehydrogenase family enzyme
MTDVGDRFQQETKYYPARLGGGMRGPRPQVYKTYPEAARVPLPAFEPNRSVTLDRVFKQRKSVRDFATRPVSLGQLSYLCWASTGIQRREHGYAFRTAPSAGALYPIETYIVAHSVRQLDPGVYHYGIERHELEHLRTGDLKHALATAALGQGICATAACVFVWTAIFERSKWKYGQRAYRYIYLDAGHIAENLALAATSLGLGTCQIGALFDDLSNEVVNIDGTEESVIYMSVVGVPARNE